MFYMSKDVNMHRHMCYAMDIMYNNYKEKQCTWTCFVQASRNAKNLHQFYDWFTACQLFKAANKYCLHRHSHPCDFRPCLCQFMSVPCHVPVLATQSRSSMPKCSASHR